MGRDVIFNCHMKAIRIEGFVFVLDEADAVTENFEFRQLLLEPLGELEAVVMNRVLLLLGRAYSRKVGGFIPEIDLFDLVKMMSVEPQIACM